MFCGQAGRLTREHIISEWISNELLHDRPKSFKWEADANVEGNPFGHKGWSYQMSLMNIIVRGLCERCNSQRMNFIENAAQPIMRPLLHGESRRLGPSQRRVLASWAALKFMVIDRMSPPKERPFGFFFTEAECHQFRASFKIPNVLLFIGCYEGVNEGWVGFVENEWRSSEGVVRTCTSMLLVGKLLFVMLGFKGSLPQGAAAGWRLDPIAGLVQYIHPPVNGRADTWPPKVRFNDDKLVSVLHHWRLTPPSRFSVQQTDPIELLPDDAVPPESTGEPETSRDQ